ncbi:hypothetical protein [Zavarzinella formosa]|uniref:hypothetical protein n=1 Tax=Zavarzinella formosa TaxID=360055 RepID=UPI0002F0EA7E|nr:hypothetical protein [Zavarzinella formosa]
MNRLICLIAVVMTWVIPLHACRADEKREEKPRFKGVELYSWKDKAGDWMFVLLDGTNRLKTEKEIKESPATLKGADELKKALARLAKGEQVSWSARDIKGLEFPPKEMRKAIQAAAKDAEIQLDAESVK